MLEVENVEAGYGETLVLFGVSLTVPDGQAICLIGRNGAGKSTTLKSIMGLLRPTGGRIRLNGQDLTGRRPHEVARAGIAYVPEDRRVFPGLTVQENLEVGRQGTPPGRPPWPVDRAFELFPRLAERRRQLAGSLSGGEQQMLTIARSLMLAPDILLLDEPSEGLAPVVVDNLVASLLRLRAERLAVLLAEQSLRVALAVSDYVYVIEKGQIKHEATKDDFAEDEATRRRYLGV